MDYPIEDIIKRSREGRHAIYPLKSDASKVVPLGTDIRASKKRFLNLDDLIIAPPQFTPLRLEKSYDLIFREPTFLDVSTESTIGGFKSRLPIVQSSMGSPDEWNIVSTYSAVACARIGLICGVGENVAATWGYDKRLVKHQPSLLERLLSYFENMDGGYGGVVIQQNEEDAKNELWNKIYSDPRLTPFIEAGFLGFEIKAGQGAKAGLGGEKLVDRKTAMSLKHEGYVIYPDPEIVHATLYERHSAPDIFTEEILYRRIKKLKNDYPRVRLWLKTGPYRDLRSVIQIASEAGIDCVSIDGKEGGTGMAPSVTIQQLGLPTLSCLSSIQKARSDGIKTSLIISGRLTNGGDLTKALALGANGIAMGRPFLLSAYAYPFAKIILQKKWYKYRFMKYLFRIIKKEEKSISYICNFIETIEIELKLLISSLGKYSLDDLSKEDVMSLKLELSIMFEIENVYQLKAKSLEISL